MQKLTPDARKRKSLFIGLLIALISCMLFLFISFSYGKEVNPFQQPLAEHTQKAAEKTEQAQDSNLLKEVNVEDLEDRTKVVIATDQPARYRFFRLANPERIEVKILAARHQLDQETIPVNQGLIDKIELSEEKIDTERIVRILIYCRKFTSYHLIRKENKIIVEMAKPGEEEVVALKPEYPETQEYLAQAKAKLLSLKKKEELIRLEEQEAKRGPQEERAKSEEGEIKSLEHFKLGQGYYKKRMLKEAIKEFESALAEDPGNKKAQTYLFKSKKKLIVLEKQWIKREQRKREKEARRSAQERDRAEREQKRAITKYWNAGKKYWRKGDFLKAGEAWSELLSLDPTFDKIDRYILPDELEKFVQSGQMGKEELETFHQLARIRGVYWQAQDKARQEKEKIKKQINRHYQLGLDYYNNGYWKEAMEQFDKLLELDCKHAKAQKLFLESKIKALEDERRKKFVEIGAEEKIREAQKLEVEEKEELKTKELQDELKEHYRLGKQYYRQGAFRKAASEFKQVLQIDPNYSLASRMLALSEKELAAKDTERRIQIAKKEYERAKEDIFKESPWGKTKLALGLSGSATLKYRYIHSTGAKDKDEYTLDRNINLNFRKTLAQYNRFLLNLGVQESDNDNRDSRIKNVKVNYRRHRLLTADSGYRQSEHNWLSPYSKSLTYTDSHVELRTDIPNLPKLHARYEKRDRSDSLEPSSTEDVTRRYQLDANHKIGPAQFWVNHSLRKFEDRLDELDDTREELSSGKVRIVPAKFLSFFQEYQKRQTEKKNDSAWGYQSDTWRSNLDLKPLKDVIIKGEYIDKKEYNKQTKDDTYWTTLRTQIISYFFKRKLFLNCSYHQQDKDIETPTTVDRDSKKTTYSYEARLRPWDELLSLSCNYRNEQEEYTTDPTEVKTDTEHIRSSLSFRPVKCLTLSAWHTLSDVKYKYQDSDVLTTSFYYQGQFRGLRGKLTFDNGFRTEEIKSTHPDSKVINNNKSVNSNLRYKFTPEFSLNMNGRYTWFEGDTDYDKTDLSSQIEWGIWDDARLGLGCNFIDFDSQTDERDYTVTILDLSLRTTF